MIFTARQLEELHKSNGHVTLPRAARLTPLANDWLRAKRIDVQYEDVASVSGGLSGGAQLRGLPRQEPAVLRSAAHSIASYSTGQEYIWWCDGPCGPAKAALAAEARSSALIASDIPPDLA